MAANPRRGELYWVSWNPARGNEQAGVRPALIVSTDAANQNPNYGNVIVAALTTRIRQTPTHVAVGPSPDSGLQQESEVMCEQIMTISKERLGQRIGQLNQGQLASVDGSVKKALALD
ncbi:MAG: type II toxin-antitoxin system PemK/MazF family toxin [Fimbriimonadales bacterium]